MSNTVTKVLTVKYKQEGGGELERIAKSIARAQQTVADASQGAYQVIDAGARQLGGAERAYRNLETRLDGASRASKQFHTDLKALDTAMRNGVIQGDQYARKLDQIKANLTAAGGPTGPEQSRALDISRRFNIGAEGNSAKASASAFEDHFREQVRAAEALRAQLDPLGTAQAKFNAELASYRALAADSVISTHELAQAEAMIGTRMLQAEKHIGAAGAATKLTTNQMTGLGYQVNDVATMLAMGASPFMVISSQAGQVVQVLGEGPGGMRGSLSAVGAGIKSAAAAALGFITPVGLMATGLTAAAAAVVYFGDNSEKNLKRAEKAADSYVDTLKRIRSAQGDVAAAAGSIFDERRLQGGETTAAQVQLEVLRQQAARKGLVENLIQTPLTAGSAMNPLSDATELIRQLNGGTSKGSLAELAAKLDAGTMKASELEETLFKLRLSPDLPTDLREIVDEMIKGATAAADVEARIDAISGATARLRLETTRANLSTAAASLRELVPDERLSPREDVERRYQQTISSAQLLPEARGAMASADADRLKALAEIDRQESVIRAGHALDLQSIGARTAAERALIAAEQERLSLSGEAMDDATKNRRIEEARTLSLAQSSFDQSESLRQRMQTEKDAVAGMMIELGVLGKTAGEAARLSTEYDALTAAKRAAYEEGRTLGEDEITRIKRHAAEIGHLTDALAAQKLAQDATFERAQLFRSDEDQQIAAPLKGCGIEIGKGSYL